MPAPFLLDSNTCIRFLNGRSASIEQKLVSAKPSDVKVRSVVKAELLYGASRSNNEFAARTKWNCSLRRMNRSLSMTGLHSNTAVFTGN